MGDKEPCCMADAHGQECQCRQRYARIEALQRENKQLREALYQIAEMPPAGAFMCGSVARAALSGENDHG